MEPFNPVSTYRLQFHGGFTLEQAGRILEYLDSLGVGTLYASPIARAVRGSTHGYDVTDPLHVNPEVGDREQFEQLITALKQRGMGWIQDVVPNHMAYSPQNPWIYDLLEKGSDSPYYRYFDLFTDHPDPKLRDRVMLPFFGKDTGPLIREGELELGFDKKGLHLQYFEERYPVSVTAYAGVLKAPAGSRTPAEVEALLRGGLHGGEWEERLKKLAGASARNRELNAYIDRCVARVNSDPAAMEELLEGLSYLPVHWQETESRINYRRFFTINGLICLNVHRKEVFHLYHRMLEEWCAKGLVDGLRIDHIDGLYEPGKYLEQLRELTGGETYLAVEKILEHGEKIPSRWPVQGTTGYDFLAQIGNLLSAPDPQSFFTNLYAHWTGENHDPEVLFRDKKRFILHHRLSGELELLLQLGLDAVPENEPDPDPGLLRQAISEFMVHCPVYRFYGSPPALSAAEKKAVKKILQNAETDRPDLHEILGILRKILLGNGSMRPGKAAGHFFRRMMQLSGPLMAKGLEDTAFYVYNPFIARNEVGDSPLSAGRGPDAFHKAMTERLKETPLTMNTLSTHDTKRGEDVRARLFVISDVPEHWKSATGSWKRMNRKYLSGGPVPADEYLVYQAMAGHLPMDGDPGEGFAGRLNEYLVKALREGKERSSWSQPDTEYEEAVCRFTRQILEAGHGFPESLKRFVKTIVPHGVANSLTQLILKNTVPGVPDTYQGCENWNLSFVDPDNRREVDFRALEKQLGELRRRASQDRESLFRELWMQPEDGRIKQWVTHVTLAERKAFPDLFRKGSYRPLRVEGRYAGHLLAYCRSYRDEHLLVAVPLHTAGMPEGHRWEDTRILLPDLLPHHWEDRLSGKRVKSTGTLEASALFDPAPFALLRSVPNQPRKRAGILMHITSLPGRYGAGDFGKGAYDFVDFLHRSGQRFWQVLPLSVTGSRTSYSPYSSRSAFAGNIQFMDPDGLEREGLIGRRDKKQWLTSTGKTADFGHAERAKTSLVEKACRSFLEQRPVVMTERFRLFCESESFWLRDFALFEALKRRLDHLPWTGWPDALKYRDPEALEAVRKEHAEEIERTMFAQFLLTEQWERLKSYANDRGIELIGDVPIYTDHDSADVWAFPDQFQLAPDGSMAAVAGVPPDYFNEDGQRWGMPLFDWEKMEQDGFRWWIRRIDRNLRWFDRVRLDHFRGFSAFWEIPAGAESAREGSWKEAPGEKLFDLVKRKYPGMPFLAEDLGQIDQAVYDLRDQYGLPGMKVYQFGFGEDMPFSHHSPGHAVHHCVAYTGTHDNNTMRGWFRREADRETLRRFRDYTGVTLTDSNVHREMIRLTLTSPARWAIVPMQDWLGLDESARMNFPSTTEGNWLWRMDGKALTRSFSARIRKMVRISGRY